MTDNSVHLCTFLSVSPFPMSDCLSVLPFVPVKAVCLFLFAYL